jgi:hypothetical protein
MPEPHIIHACKPECNHGPDTSTEMDTSIMMVELDKFEIGFDHLNKILVCPASFQAEVK